MPCRYKNGISGPFWYAAGATIQILVSLTPRTLLCPYILCAHNHHQVICFAISDR